MAVTTVLSPLSLLLLTASAAVFTMSVEDVILTGLLAHLKPPNSFEDFDVGNGGIEFLLVVLELVEEVQVLLNIDLVLIVVDALLLRASQV